VGVEGRGEKLVCAMEEGGLGEGEGKSRIDDEGSVTGDA
jgi:hypothetical protein